MKLRTKIKCATVLTAVVAIAVLCVASSWFARERFKGLMELQVRAVALTVAAGVRGEALASLTGPESIDTADYAELNHYLRRVQIQNSASDYPFHFVYLIVPTRHASTTGFDFAVDSCERLLASGAVNPEWDAPGVPYNASSPDGQPALIDGRQDSARYLHDRLGEWLSGYAPIRAADGSFVGLAGIDIDHQRILSQLDWLWLLAVAVALVLSALVYFTVDRLVDRFLRPIERMGAFVREVGAGKFDGRLNLDPRTELGEVGAELNAMAESLGDRERLAQQNSALTIDNSALTIDVRRKHKTLAAISDVDANLHEVQDLDTLLERILSDARKLLDCDAGSVMIREGNDLVLKYVQNSTLETEVGTQNRPDIRGTRILVNGGSIAGYAASTGKPIEVADAYEIPSDSPYHFNRSVDEASGYRTRAILALPLRTSAGKNVGVLQLLNPQDESRAPRAGFTPAEVATMTHFGTMATIAIERAELTRALVLRMTEMAEMRDPAETFGHITRVAQYAVVLFDAWCRHRRVDPVEAQRQRDVLRIAAMLHDVGKVGIPDAVLNKPGRLTAEEYSVMQRHCVIGARLFSNNVSVLDLACFDVALHHHERWDGGGYPGVVNVVKLAVSSDEGQGDVAPMKGEAIPLFSRIVSVADVFDALSSKRQYKEAWPEPRVIAEMRINAGRQFDPELIEILLESSTLDQFRAVAARYPG